MGNSAHGRSRPRLAPALGPWVMDGGRRAQEPGGRRRGRARRWILAAVALWLAAAGVLLALAGLEARAGLRAAERAREAASVDVTSSPALDELRRADDRFGRAAARAGSPVVAPLKVLPVLGRQIRSLDALATGAAEVAGVSARALEAGQEALATTPAGRDHAPELLRTLGGIATDADRELAGVDLGPDEALVGPLGSAHNTLAARLAELRSGLSRGAAGARAAAELLAGPRRYLILAANNAEMRAGTGMFLSAGVLETGHGGLLLSPFRRTEELALPPGAASLSGDLADRWGWLKPNEEWRNLGVSPRFDATAPLAAAMWEAGGGEPVDGVLAVDPLALRAILVAVGPVEVEGRTVGADDVVDRLLHDQYLQFADDPAQTARREELGLIAGAVMQAVDTRDWKADELGRELAAAARGRHVLAWSRHEAEQAGWVAAGIDGSLREDSVLVAVLNRGGNKLDRFLRVGADLDLQRLGAVTRGVLTLTLRNQTPLGEPPYVAGPHPDSGAAEGEYVGLVAVSLPAGARDARFEGHDALAVAGPDGPTRVVAVPAQVPRDEEVTLVVRFELPYTGGSLRIEPTARVPGVAWSSGDDHWEDGGRHELRW